MANCSDLPRFGTRTPGLLDANQGASLLAVNRCSPARVWTFAQDSRSADGLLYLAAVRANWREQAHRQGMVDTSTGLAEVWRVEASARRQRANLTLTRPKTQGRACTSILDIAASADF
jgi:hypothetical protein